MSQPTKWRRRRRQQQQQRWHARLIYRTGFCATPVLHDKPIVKPAGGARLLLACLPASGASPNSSRVASGFQPKAKTLYRNVEGVRFFDTKPKPVRCLRARAYTRPASEARSRVQRFQFRSGPTKSSRPARIGRSDWAPSRCCLLPCLLEKARWLGAARPDSVTTTTVSVWCGNKGVRCPSHTQGTNNSVDNYKNKYQYTTQNLNINS